MDSPTHLARAKSSFRRPYPRRHRNRPQRRKRHDPRTLKAKGNIVIAVHDPETRGMLNNALKDAGHDVTLAKSVSEVQWALDETDPDLLLLDYELPDNGAKTICEHNESQVPVLMLAPRAKSEDVLACLDVGAHDVISRPFFIPELLARARSMIRTSLLMAELRDEKKDFEALLDITRTIARPKNSEDTLNELVKKLSKHLAVDRATVVIQSRDPKFGYAAATSDMNIEPGLQIDLRKYPEVTRTIERKKVLIVEDVMVSDVLAPLRNELKKAGITSLLAVPISPEGEAAATLVLHTRGKQRKFTRREIRLCAAVAEAAGAALRTARLFRAVRG